MQKALTKLLICLMIGFFSINAVTPFTTSVYAAEEKADNNQQPQGPDMDKKKNDSGHSGHH